MSTYDITCPPYSLSNPYFFDVSYGPPDDELEEKKQPSCHHVLLLLLLDRLYWPVLARPMSLQLVGYGSIVFQSWKFVKDINSSIWTGIRGP